VTYIVQNEDTGDFDLIDSLTGEVVDSVCDRYAAQGLAAMYNGGEA
jgi:hypothetical protein